eukprot:Hpha_TRINITY_DN16654_c0_g17::TRINITY_DN16654_c0_g17_i1::g.183302::m.183302/K03320/amt, AMT, MEP; ammonium transporter, Amt family
MRHVLLGFAVLVGLVGVQGLLPTDWNTSPYGVAACTDATSSLCCCATGNKGNGPACTQTELYLCEIQKLETESSGDCKTKSDTFKGNADQIWIMMAGSLVFFMQCGFAMLEAGSVRSRNTQNIIFKNLLDICVAALTFFCFGYAFAYGEDSGNFIGKNNFFLIKENNDETGQHMWFFQFAFAATASTIVSGSVAERTELTAYFIYAIVLTGFIYPVVVHWVWSPNGWLSAFASRSDRVNPNGMIDYAGSGVVHCVGGWAGLIGAWMVGPRKGRFEETGGEDGSPIVYGKALTMRGQSTMLASLGALILWFGWYGFNAGSTLAWDGENAGKVAVTTTLSAGMAGLTSTFLSRFWEGHWSVDAGLNGILGGLVSITAGCSVVDEWPAVAIGAIGGLIYYFAANFLLIVHIDDPLNAWPVHGACGVWGCLAVGIFATERNFRRAYGDGYDFSALDDGRQFATQLLGTFCIVSWVVGTCLIMFFLIKNTVGMRVSAEVEQMGCDAHHHGADLSASLQFHSNPNAVAAFTATVAGVDSRPTEWKPPAELYEKK